MPQITLHLPDETQIKLRRAAKEKGLSQSKWVTQLIEEELAEKPTGTSSSTQWPQELLDLAGAWPDAPTAEEIRASYGEDVLRETF